VSCGAFFFGEGEASSNIQDISSWAFNVPCRTENLWLLLQQFVAATPNTLSQHRCRIVLSSSPTERRISSGHSLPSLNKSEAEERSYTRVNQTGTGTHICRLAAAYGTIWSIFSFYFMTFVCLG
jgi:hypothetical protein